MLRKNGPLLENGPLVPRRTRPGQRRRLGVAGAVAVLAVASVPAEARPRWTVAEADRWHAGQPWLMGANYLPATAINQLEMWQADTFDPVTIDRELGWARGLGMNTMRVFLHDLLWEQDAEAFSRRLDQFLAIARRHRIRPMLVLFDSCWDPRPKLGLQHPPVPGVHNSGWVQSPGTQALADPGARPRLERYVRGIVGRFAQDDRILAWDVWNEPDSPAATYPGQPRNKEALVAALLPSAFAWARAAEPSQPVTSGIAWGDDWSPQGKHSAIERTQLAESDIMTFHDYGWPEQFAKRVAQLQSYGRPIIATEFMARGAGSTFDGVLPIAKRANVGTYAWGFVAGKSQTWLPWDSWSHPYVLAEPTIWFHDVLRADGTPYRAAEAALMRQFASGKRDVASRRIGRPALGAGGEPGVVGRD